MKIKLIASLSMLLFATPVNSTTVERLIEIYGKEAIMKAIAAKIDKKFTISIDGKTKQAYAPSTDYIYSWTLTEDIARAGMTPRSIEQIFLNQAEIAKSEQNRKLEIEQKRNDWNEKQRQDAEKYRNEELKFFATASDQERRQFRIARLNGELKQAESNQLEKYAEKSHETQNNKNVKQLNPICEINKEKLSADIKNNLTSKYPGSYRLQKSLLDSNMSSYDELCAIQVDDIAIEVLNKHLKRYYPSISLIQTLFESDIKAYQELKQ
jgi:hypothetical protein